MKRILFCVLLSFVTYSARAESWMLFSAAAVEDSINTMVEPEYRAATADEYEKQMDSTTGKITASGILSVCATAGWAINTDEGFYFCRGFVDNIAELSGVSSNAAKQCKQMNGIRTVLDDGSNQCIGRDGTVLVYSNACRGGDGECVEFFADLRTQVPNALEFIYEYGKSNNLKFTCSNEIVDIHKIGSDYIKCSANKTAYEFKFDTLNQSYNRRMVDSENAALCKMFGGTVAGTDDYWTMCDMERAKCDKLATFAPTIGHSAMYQGSCRISRTVNTRDNIFLNHIDGVDSYVFYDVKIRSGVAKPMLEQYLTSIFPDEEYITCDSDIVELNDPTSLGTNWIMQCTVGTQQVDFIFDELATQSDAQTMTGMDIMQCIINGGTFNGETCRGLTATECDALDAKLRASGSENGAYYDDDMRACVLGNAMATYQRNVVAGYVIGAVVIVGGTVLTIASGGAAVPVVINGVAMLAGDLAINYTIDANHRRLSEKAAKKFVDFVTDADACTTEQCALDVLEKHYATLSGVMSDLNTDDRTVVDETMDRLIGLIQTEFVACGENESGQTVYASPADCAMQQSKLTLLDHIDPISEVALIIGSVIYDPGYVVARFTRLKNVTKTITQTVNTLDALTSQMTRGIDNALQTLDDINDARIALQNQAETVKQLLGNNVDLIKNASTIEEAQRYADNATQLAFALQNRADDATSAVSALLRDNTANELTAESLRSAQQYADEISAIARQSQEIADESTRALDAKRLQLNAAKRSDMDAALARADARRTNTSEYITEPVMYFRAIQQTDKSPEEIVQILNNAGIRASTDVSDQSAWVINRSSVSGSYELVSPFMAPETATQQFDIVNDILRQNSIRTSGAVTPTTISQIDPTVVTGTSRDQAMINIRNYFDNNPTLYEQTGLTPESTNDELLGALIENIRHNNQFTAAEYIRSDYAGQDVLYRGQKFSTSDPGSAYANMSPKAGTTGNALGTTDHVYAVSYAGTGAISNGGAGLSAEHIGVQEVSNRRVGFLNVYKNSDKNVFYNNATIEDLSDDILKNPLSSSGASNIPETLITPQDNPVIDRYIVVNDGYFKLENDNEIDRLVMDAFAPDLSKTYNADMIRRIENVESGMTNGVPQTYNLPGNVMNSVSPGN